MLRVILGGAITNAAADAGGSLDPGNGASPLPATLARR